MQGRGCSTAKRGGRSRLLQVHLQAARSVQGPVPESECRVGRDLKSVAASCACSAVEARGSTRALAMSVCKSSCVQQMVQLLLEV